MKKQTKLAVAPQPSASELAKRQLESNRWNEAEERLKITRQEAGRRVSALRKELESYQAQIESLPFCIASGNMGPPLALDCTDRKYTLQLVEELNPLVNGYVDMIDTYNQEHGTDDGFDFQSKLLALETHAAETGFEIGVLAGVIFSGASKHTIDRFERGLAFVLALNDRIVKD